MAGIEDSGGVMSASELEAAERVANGLVHEIRNVLNPIVSAAYLLQTNAANPDKVRELAQKIEGFAKAEARVLEKKNELLEQEAHRVHPTGASS
jgi:nitrogen-specific signal transduction histidine kinase